MNAEEQTDQSDNEHPVVPKPRTSRPRLITLLWVVVSFIVLGTLAFAHLNNSMFEDRFGQGLDVLMVLTYLGVAIVWLMWMIWMLAFSRWQWRYRIAGCIGFILLPFGFFQVFRPVNGGDANIVRFEPIWSTNSEPDVIEIPGTESNSVDLNPESPNDFPAFLGTNRNAIVDSGLRIDDSGFSSAKLKWKQPIGKGWSGFVARNGLAVTMEQRGDRECVTCYRIDSGELQWIYTNPARHQDSMNLGRIGPRSTPTIFDGRVYAVGAVGNLVCLEGSSGQVVWQADLNELLDIELAEGSDPYGNTIQYEDNTALAWGRSGSPLVVDQHVIVPGGGPRNGPKSTLLAFDRQSGELAWRGGTEMIAYGSPALARVAGIDQILFMAESRAMGFDPETGHVLWQYSRPGQSDASANTSQVTVVSSDTLLTSKGYPDGGGKLLKLSSVNDELHAETVWDNPRVLKTKLTSPVIHNGHAYSLSNGFMECARLTDGERIWKRRGRFGHGQMLLIGDRLLAHSEDGMMYLIVATPDGYKELGSFPTIDGVCWNTLCLFGSRLLVRSELEAACFQLAMVAED